MNSSLDGMDIMPPCSICHAHNPSNPFLSIDHTEFTYVCESCRGSCDQRHVSKRVRHEIRAGSWNDFLEFLAELYFSNLFQVILFLLS